VKQNLQLFAHEAARTIFRNTDPSVKTGAGHDDAALLTVESEELLVSSDYVNFKRISDQYKDKDYYDLGRYCVKQNVSDIFGSGGLPRWFMLSVLLEDTCTEHELTALFEGVRDECDRFGITVVGGDTKQGRTTAIHGTIIGTLSGNAWNKGPIPDKAEIFVSGAISGVSAALCLLEFSTSVEHKQAAFKTLHEADLPKSCLEAIHDHDLDLCASDISDGLGYTLHEFLRVNPEHCLTLDIGLIPLHPLARIAAGELGVHERCFCFGFGGDFQMALVASPENRSILENAGATRVGSLKRGKTGKVTYRSRNIGKLPKFGHLDFETQPPAQRFRKFATDLSRYISEN